MQTESPIALGKVKPGGDLRLGRFRLLPLDMQHQELLLDSEFVYRTQIDSDAEASRIMFRNEKNCGGPWERWVGIGHAVKDEG